jgi:hypothetical protein
MSPDGRIEAPIAPPGVLPNLEGLAGACGFEQNVAQPRGVATLKIERVTEYPSLMSAARCDGFKQ